MSLNAERGRYSKFLIARVDIHSVLLVFMQHMEGMNDYQDES